MNGGSGINPNACAACMHQRKRCEKSCELAPYFPASRYEEFEKAFKHFGLSNIVRIMNSVEPHHRQAAAESILFEGIVRLNHPVHGCLGIIQTLLYWIRFYKSELQAVNQQLAFFKGNNQHPKHEQLDNSIASSSSTILPLQPVHDLFDEGDNSRELNLEEDPTLEFFDTHSTDQIMDMNQDGNEITSVPSDTKGK
ncbi:hypothetical protein REPUB_Repub18cG0109800 [Reevesia pubescens]